MNLNQLFNNISNYYSLILLFVNKNRSIWKSLSYNTINEFFDILFFLIPIKLILFYDDIKKINIYVLFFLLFALALLITVRIVLHINSRTIIKNNLIDEYKKQYLLIKKLPIKIKYYNREYVKNINFLTKFLINVLLIIFSLILNLYLGILLFLIFFISISLFVIAYSIICNYYDLNLFLELKKIIEIISFFIIIIFSFIVFLIFPIDIRLLIITIFLSRLIIQNNMYLINALIKV